MIRSGLTHSACDMFFQSYGLHRDLHSFPTRRSSDLAPTTTSPVSVPTQGTAPVAEPGAAARSEEHTSELQSRLHLVCRLLLEKKKRLSVSKQSMAWARRNIRNLQSMRRS